MGYLFENYMSDMPEEDVVKKLKMGINNTYNSFYREILDERELLEASDSRKLSYYDSQNFQLEEKFVINLFNEIGFNTDEISSKREYVDILGDGTLDGCFYHYHYLVEDLWNFIQGLNSYYFYGVMVYISQTSTTNKVLLQLQQAIKDELLRNRISIREHRKTVFIAMAFADEMNKPREAIMRAIEDKAYKAIVIDEKEHNEQIVPQVFEEINRAEFVIADLTLHRNGVYYEAGYAKGLHKQVIFTCRADDFGNSHFDVKQINTIMWKDESELEDKLRKRIESMMTNELEEQHVPF